MPALPLSSCDPASFLNLSESQLLHLQCVVIIIPNPGGLFGRLNGSKPLDFCLAHEKCSVVAVVTENRFPRVALVPTL